MIPLRAVETGAWSGEPCYVVGGGPSLKGFDWSRLDAERWIGCNVAAFYGPSIALAADRRFVERFGADARIPPSTQRVWQGTELPVWHPPPPWQSVKVAHREDGWTRRLEDGLVLGPCTGVAALHLADILGASPICLLGFDLHDDGGQTRNWHEEYATLPASEGWRGGAAVYASFREAFERWAPHVRGVVLNLNPTSALTCFPRRSPPWEDACET